MPAGQLDAEVEHVSWGVFLSDVFDWRQGEHVTAVGPTGTGKTTLLLGILDRRQYVCVIASKPKDATLAGLVKRDHFQRIKAWPPPMSRAPMRAGRPTFWRVLLWPTYRRMSDLRTVATAIRHALHEMFAQGGWCVVADDMNKLCEQLGLADDLKPWWTDGRSVGLTLVASVQRPRNVPLYAYSQATHLFLWRTNDAEDVKRIGGLNGVNNKLVQSIVVQLDPHDVLYVNTRTGRMAVTRAERR